VKPSGIGDQGQPTLLLMVSDIPAVPTILVVDPCTGPHNPDAGAHRVAKHLGLQLVLPRDTKRLVKGEPLDHVYILVVGSPEDARMVPSATSLYPVYAVVAWRLAEAAVLDLIRLSTPVFSGLPDLEQWADGVAWAAEPAAKEQQRKICNQLAILERRLGDLAVSTTGETGL